jgi:hypothetical protein
MGWDIALTTFHSDLGRSDPAKPESSQASFAHRHHQKRCSFDPWEHGAEMAQTIKIAESTCIDKALKVPPLALAAGGEESFSNPEGGPRRDQRPCCNQQGTIPKRSDEQEKDIAPINWLEPLPFGVLKNRPGYSPRSLHKGIMT